LQRNSLRRSGYGLSACGVLVEIRRIDRHKLARLAIDEEFRGPEGSGTQESNAETKTNEHQ